MIQTVTEILHHKHGIDAKTGKKNECPFCGKKTFSIKADDSVGKCFHPACQKSINSLNTNTKKDNDCKLYAWEQGCTLKAYSEAKKIPVEFLAGLGLDEISYASNRTIRIPYFDENGQEAAIRYRTALKKAEGADNRFRWKSGSKPLPYGLWRLGEAKKKGFVVMVEGESDCHTLWYHKIPALGIPGANMWKEQWADYLDDIPVIYMVVEPDAGGKAVLKWLDSSRLKDRIYIVDLGETKDPSNLHLQDPDNFKNAWEKAIEESKPFKSLLSKIVDERKKELWKQCNKIAELPNILHEFLNVIGKKVVGEERLVQLIYLIVSSRVFKKPISCVIKGPSSAGKSYTVEQVLNFFSKNAFYELTAMSEKALAYSEEPLKHRFILIFEADGIKNDFTSYLIRTLLSEGKLKYETVEKTNNGFKPRLIEREGPTGLIVTTTAIQLHPENETRMLSIPVTDTQEHTRNVLIALANEDKPDKLDLSDWIAFQEWIGLNSSMVKIPYSKILAKLVPPVAVRLRRDFSAILGLIKTHALLHQTNRERDEKGRIVATLDDYACVRELIADLISDGVDSTVSTIVRETVEVTKNLLEKNDKDSVTNIEIAHALNLDKSAAWRRVRSAIDKDYLKNNEDRKAKPAKIVLGNPLPEEVEILPTVRKLKEYYCMNQDNELNLKALDILSKFNKNNGTIKVDAFIYC